VFLGAVCDMPQSYAHAMTGRDAAIGSSTLLARADEVIE
jgi:hypothetical protein